MAYTPIFYRGREIDIGHLAPMSLGCPCIEIGREIAVGVIFRNHCYTEKFDPEKHDRSDIIHYDAEDRPRAFCPTRHKLSLRLPQLITQLPTRKVQQTSVARNYVYSVPIEFEGTIYQIFFMLQRQKQAGLDLRLTVESAYPVLQGAQLRRRPNTIRFSVLAFKTLRGDQIRFAPR